jgi:hypothetical protein
MKKVQQFAAEAADREAIRDCQYRYARAVDRLDVELLRECHWPDASIDFGALTANSLDEIVEKLEPIWATMFPCKHLMGNMLIEIAGTQATLETYHHSFDRGQNADGSWYERISSGRYLDRLEKRDDEWRFIHRRVVLDWNQMWTVEENGGVMTVLDQLDATSKGLRKPDDLSYRVLRPEATDWRSVR